MGLQRDVFRLHFSQYASWFEVYWSGVSWVEIIKLVLILVLPIATPVMGMYLAFCVLQRKVRGLIELFSLKPNESLFRQPAFWLSVLIPFGYFIAFGVVSWEGYVIDVSRNGLANFLSISTLPLGMLSIAIPATVIVASFHSTEQTAAQILITQHKNNMESFYAHRSELFLYFQRIGELDYFGCFKALNRVHPRMHSYFFIGSPSQGIPEIREDVFEDLEGDLIAARKFIHMALTLESSDERLVSCYLLNACNMLHVLIRKLNLTDAYHELEARSELVLVNVVNEGAQRVLTVGNSTCDMVAVYRYARAYFRNLCDFAGRAFDLGDSRLYDYFETEGEFVRMKDQGNVEYIHEHVIPKLPRPKK